MGPSVRTSVPSWRGCGRRTPSCGCSVMCSSARWPSGSPRRWAGSRGRLHRRPEGRARHSARGRLPSPGGQPGLVLPVGARRPVGPARTPGDAGNRGRPAVAQHHGRYGSPPITADLRAAGWQVSENTVAALMREQHLAARRKRRRRSTTRPGRAHPPAPDLIGRSFAAEALNRKWYGDGTEIATDEGKRYLDSVLDMGSRRIVGFALGEHHDAELAYAAWGIAVRGGKEAVAG